MNIEEKMEGEGKEAVVKENKKTSTSDKLEILGITIVIINVTVLTGFLVLQLTKYIRRRCLNSGMTLTPLRNENRGISDCNERLLQHSTIICGCCC